jgi:hypothetical protein
MSLPLHLPSVVTPGYVVLMDSGDPLNPADWNKPENWNYVVLFAPQTVQLITDACDCFPTFSQVMAQSHMFILDRPSVEMPGFTKYVPGRNVYYIESDGKWNPLPADETETPEPASLLLTGAGLSGLALFRRYRNQL